MVIIRSEGKNIASLLPPEDAKQVLLALFSRAEDMPEMTPLAFMAYTIIGSKAQKTVLQSMQSDNGDTGLQERRFEEFWQLYPRKVGKAAAQKAWWRIKPAADHHTKILAAINEAKKCEQWKADNGRYIPNPATWLNQGRWDDEILSNNSKRKNSNSNYLINYIQREYDDEFLKRFTTSEFGTKRLE